MKGYGVVLKRLRQINKLSLDQAAKLLGRSKGWLSQVENECGYARLKPEVFEDAVKIFKGESYRKQFSGWMTASKVHHQKQNEISFDGSILKFLRNKAELTLSESAKKSGFSCAYICSLENGTRPLSKEIRDRLVQLYGYSTASFRNFTDENKRAGNIPTNYKIKLFLKQLNSSQLEKVFNFLESEFNNKG